MDIQTDVGQVVNVLAGNKPDDFADLAFGEVEGFSRKKVMLSSEKPASNPIAADFATESAHVIVVHEEKAPPRSARQE